MSDQPISLKSTLKSSDTEENIDVYFTRPIGLLWARFFRALHIHPNVVTILSIILGVGAAYFMYQGEGNLLFTLIGIALLAWANFYDSADGQLARMTGQKTLWGRILDGFAGNVWFICIYLAVGLRLYNQPMVPGWSESPNWHLTIFVLLLLIGTQIHGPQSRLADYYRNIHLYFIRGKAQSELDSSRQLRQDFAEVSPRQQPAWKIFLWFYINYTQAQEQATPQFQQFKRMLDEHYPTELPASLVETFRAGSLPLMKWANALTFNWRAFVLYASLLLAVWHPWAVILFPLADITVFLVIYIHMHRQHEALCQRLRLQIELETTEE